MAKKHHIVKIFWDNVLKQILIFLIKLKMELYKYTEIVNIQNLPCEIGSELDKEGIIS